MRRVVVPVGWRARARVAALVAAGAPAVPAPAVGAVGVVRAVEAFVRRWLAPGRRGRLLPDALERMATALRSGSSLLQALGDAAATCPAPLGAELQRLVREGEAGRPLQQVLAEWVGRHDDVGTRLCACALAVAAAAGAAPARALDGVAATLRDRIDLADERRVLSTQARASALVLSSIPLLAVPAMVLLSPDTARFLFGTPTGWICFVGGVGINLAGALCMWRMTRGRQ